MKNNTGRPVNQGRIYVEGHGYVVGWTVTVRGTNSREYAQTAAETMAAHCPSRTARHWLDSIVRRAEYGKLTTFFFAEII